MWRKETIHKFIKLQDFSILRKEEQELYKLLSEKTEIKSKIDELESELKILKPRYKALQDPWISKMLGITKQSIFTRRTNLLDKINRIYGKNTCFKKL